MSLQPARVTVVRQDPYAFDRPAEDLFQDLVLDLEQSEPVGGLLGARLALERGIELGACGGDAPLMLLAQPRRLPLEPGLGLGAGLVEYRVGLLLRLAQDGLFHVHQCHGSILEICAR